MYLHTGVCEIVKIVKTFVTLWLSGMNEEFGTSKSDIMRESTHFVTPVCGSTWMTRLQTKTYSSHHLLSFL